VRMMNITTEIYEKINSKIESYRKKKDKNNLFVFSRESGLRIPQLSELMRSLNEEGFKGIAVIIKDVKELSVIEQ